MANSRVLVPEAKEGLNQFKMESATEVGVTLKNGYNGDLTAREAGSIGGPERMDFGPGCSVNL